MGKFYLFEVEVFVHSTGKVERNMVTDPYSLQPGDEQHAQPDRQPRTQRAETRRLGYGLQASPVAAPEDISIYEIHVRDFSVHDPLVPEALKGTFKAFTCRIHTVPIT
jgi:pullulanase